jgi:hypothetical protein
VGEEEKEEGRWKVERGGRMDEWEVGGGGLLC